MIIIALLSIIFATLFNLDNISVAGSIGFLVIFALVNLANLKLYKETGANRLIAGFGTFLCVAAVIVLVGYNALYSPTSLLTSGVVILIVFMFSFFYHRFKERESVLSLFMDKRLERDEMAKQKKN